MCVCVHLFLFLQYAASHGIKFMEISAQTGQRVEEAFLTLARDIKDEMDQEMVHKTTNGLTNSC